MQKKGIILKGIAGFYYVELEDQRRIECKARGRFRKDKMTPVVGDRVLIEEGEQEKGFILEILPRVSLLARPAVANVDQAFIVFALKRPEINYMLLDKLLILTEHHQMRAVLCINKADLGDEGEFLEIQRKYSRIGYDVIQTNGKDENGADTLAVYLKDRISVFVGPSGVGKSTLFNKLQHKVSMETGELSEKVDRGKHTTRHAELIETEPGSYLVDTPGFSSFSIDFMPPEELQYAFREFGDLLHSCKYTSCLHDKETGCRIKQEVESGSIDRTRYETYIGLLNELQLEYAYRRNKR